MGVGLRAISSQNENRSAGRIGSRLVRVLTDSWRGVKNPVSGADETFTLRFSTGRDPAVTRSAVGRAPHI